MEFSAELLLLFFLIAMLAGCIDAIAGGGGLITLPALLALGIPPAAAIATNKLGAAAGSFSSALYFVRIREVHLGRVWPMMLTTFIGSLTGALVLTRIDNSLLKSVIPILLIAFSIYFLLSPRLGEADKKQLLSPAYYLLLIAPAIGFYDGFFGPGTGAFLSIGFVLLLGYNMIKATAHAKVLNFCSNLAALLFFILHGGILWSIGLAMLAGQLLGGNLGARMAVRSGHRLIRVVMISVSLSISIKILFFDS
ncbi:TSUP family transporter [Stutzerimonas kirkiae]|uniref:Probable membrane transporter protein n=1 Tax=Stutzerimonas kirkiae TaxID=2211392 RepID=A0A4Q9R6S7_9GAMM|nr:TSUP family transporter [Stutzerimonas kirkiae]TBU96290.1 hypothetical protein DNJ96_10965 [Stutzerimonas kirkiae]TBV03367.1 hypothetical protein DNJ95_07165 [Stutzerimonas kirkiae]TBV04741.1 hypothetical protein DNK08_16770 [Stutzerimonas kirkiae]TBV12888.1 hypothetical protein DNK01_13265 [Stutzerimonas kirkiae]